MLNSVGMSVDPWMLAWPRRARTPPPGRPMLPSSNWRIAAVRIVWTPVLEMRIQSALRAGLSRQEIIDIFAQMALGTGLPVALAATKVAADAFGRVPD